MAGQQNQSSRNCGYSFTQPYQAWSMIHRHPELDWLGYGVWKAWKSSLLAWRGFRKTVLVVYSRGGGGGGHKQTFKPKCWANLFKDFCFVLFFCFLVHRLAVRISFPFHILYKLLLYWSRSTTCQIFLYSGFQKQIFLILRNSDSLWGDTFTTLIYCCKCDQVTTF